MEDMSKTRKSLATTKGKDTSRRAKPLVAGVSYMGVDGARHGARAGGTWDFITNTNNIFNNLFKKNEVVDKID